jgi:hypothetical protein
MSNDIAIAPGNMAFVGAPSLKKPPYLVVMERMDKKTQVIERFISLDKPESINGFIQVKGIYSDKTEDDIIKNFNDILIKTAKDAILEMMFPLQRVLYIRSLVFSAVKK